MTECEAARCAWRGFERVANSTDKSNQIAVKGGMRGKETCASADIPSRRLVRGHRRRGGLASVCQGSQSRSRLSWLRGTALPLTNVSPCPSRWCILRYERPRAVASVRSRRKTGCGCVGELYSGIRWFFTRCRAWIPSPPPA
ncbi:hypothetical protein E2C01_095914 [Portunus trituberculatus]|uniref:Uncharacterized protein n=1 Tax=Portunus trituberculatus TaxID=210409 RepID=A0A5B7JU96_PORTR|nr:hypothetical protein [Portunus trituberculatus]